MGSFFATKKSTKSTIGKAYCQLFVADKSFLHVEQLSKRSDLTHALNSFAKKVGVPEEIIVDGAPEYDSREVKKFYNQSGTSIRTL